MPQTCEYQLLGSLISMDFVSIDMDQNIATVTLRRTNKLNSLNDQMIAELDQSLILSADQARVVVLRAEPEVKVFSAGHDISEVPTGVDATAWENPVEELICRIPTLPVPVIAAVSGTVWGAATNIVVACDVVIARNTSSFAITPAKLGVPYFTAGLDLFIQALPLPVVRSMFFTATPLAAEQAHQFGLVSELATSEAELTDKAYATATRIASLAPLTVRTVKAQLAGQQRLNAVQHTVVDQLRQQAWLSEDVREGITAFHERRSAQFQGR